MAATGTGLERIRSEYKAARQNPKPAKILISEYDQIIFISVLILLLIGIVMIFSSSYYTALMDKKIKNNMYYYFLKQSAAAGIGFVVMGAAALINYHVLKPFVGIAYVVANLLLVYVKFFGEEINGAKRWIQVPVFGSFQPSEFAKAAVILLLAFYISGGKDRTTSLRGLAGCGIIVGIPVFLVFWGNNLSTALIIGAIGFAIIFVSSPYFMKLIALAAGAAGALVIYMTAFSDSFRGARFAVWRDPWIDPMDKGFQIIQSLYAVGSGGLFGLGLGQSRQKLKFMPEPHNDFIFAIICEELGFFGAAVVMLLFSVLIWRGIKVALNAMDFLGTLLATGIVTQVGVQVIINVAVVTNTIPNTGIPMPFISYGGTSIVFVMGLVGILLNISRYSKIKIYDK